LKSTSETGKVSRDERLLARLHRHIDGWILVTNGGNLFERDNRQPDEVLTELHVETFSHRASGHSYRCVQFRRAD
jgi:hypothetical protein